MNNKKILLIDDEVLVLRSLTKLLEKNGFGVVAVTSGNEAINKFIEEEFDLIIADIRMPGINGVDTVEHIHKLIIEKRLPNKKVPVIFITGYADRANEQKAAALNPAAYIYKPFDIEELVRRVKEILGKDKE